MADDVMRTGYEVSGAGVELGMRYDQACRAQSLCSCVPPQVCMECSMIVHIYFYACPVDTSRPLLRCSLAFHGDRSEDGNN